MTELLHKKWIFMASPHMSDEGFEMQYLHEAFDSNWIAPLGPNVNGFEKELALKMKIKSAAAVVTGTAAIHLGLKALGVGEGDIVIGSSFTFAGSVNPIVYLNAVPVFVDSDYETWNMDPVALEKALEKYKGRVKAVVVVHLYGMSADMDRIMEVCNRFNVPVLEDAAESLGATYKGINTGTIGKIGIYSFNGNKIITTSGGGMLVSDDEELVKKVRFWSTQSKDVARYYQHTELGYNYRMSNIVAGIGRGQLKVLDQRLKKKKYIFEYYKHALSNIKDIDFMPDNDWNKPNYWLSCITLKGKVKPIEIMEALEKECIESRHLWKPMHMQPFFKDYDYFGDHVSEDLFNRGVCLPSDTKMTDADLERVCNVIKGLF